MHPTAVAGLVSEIAPRVVGSKIVAAYAAGGDCLVAEISTDTPSFLVIVTLRALPLMFLTEGAEAAPPRAGASRAAVERELGGAVIEAFRVAEDTTVELSFRKTLPTGRTVARVLEVDLGRRPRALVRDAGVARDDLAAERSGDAVGGPADRRGGPSVAWRHDAAGRIHVRVSASAPPEGVEASRSFGSVNEAAAFAFDRFWAPLNLERRRRAVRREVATTLRRKRRAIEKVRAEIEGAARAEELRRRGHLLLTRQGEVPRGAKRAELLDYDGATRVGITLDPALSPSKNAEILFRRARKAERRARAAPARLEELEREERRLREIVERIDRAPEREVAALESEYGRPGRARGRAAKGGVRARYRTYTVAGGWEVLVGKTNRDNDVLTHRIARPQDLWFHVRQAPGSHVILRRPDRKTEPDKRAILEAAAIAAFHSKAGRSTKVPVCYTERRYVRKPRGARPGLAVVSREKVVFVEPKLPQG